VTGWPPPSPEERAMEDAIERFIEACEVNPTAAPAAVARLEMLLLLDMAARESHPR
jgi:hypothetical protein